MASGKEIRRRIKSIKGTGKITKAMEMVAAAKMRKAVSQVLAIRPYAHSAWSVLTNLSRVFTQENHGLLEVRPVKSILAIVVTSNRGLCGSFNANVFRKVKEELDNPEKLMINRIWNGKEINEDKLFRGIKIPKDKLKIDFVTIGKKGESFIRRLDRKIIATFSDLASVPNIGDVQPLLKVIIKDYLERKYDKVVVFYTDYFSVVKQETKIRQILPISKVDIEKQIAEMDVLAKEYNLNEPVVEYKVEPSPEEVLNYILPRLIEMQVYHAILESNASKESAQMVAMKNATEAATEMADDLTFAYNQIRQMKITQEIAEISAGRAALEQ